jgi:CubicO group peptidase (beta-lactamase class C family)
MKKTLIFITLHTIATLAFAQTPKDYKAPIFTDANRIEKIKATKTVVEKILQDYAAANHFPGYAYGIVVDEQLVYSGSNGYADIEKKIPATTKSMFRIASMSKSFTAMAILKLRDEGKLKLDDPAYLYISELKNQSLTTDAPVITIRNLLSHSAGFPEDNPWGDRHLADTEQELINSIKKGISFSNTTSLNYEYSNLAFCMLGLIIHKVSGEYYADYIEKNIWKPLQMNAAWEYTKVEPSLLAHGYRWLNNDWREEALLHDGIGGAMGGMISSVESFAKYVSFHLNAWPPRNDQEEGPIKRNSIREMHQPWTYNTFNPNYKFPNGRGCGIVTSYGYGLGITKDCEGRTMVAHSGGLPGFGSNWRILPDYGMGVILLANVTYAPTSIANLAVLDTIVRMAKLQPRQLPASNILTQRRDEIMKLLPNFSTAKTAGIFAENFFEDYFVDSLKKEATNIFNHIGKIKKVNDVVPENQLRGYFIIECENGNAQINFTLTPEHIPLIQEYHIRLLKN